MSTSMLGRSLSLMSSTLGHEERVDLIVSIIVDWTVIMPIFVVWGVLPYGRYNAKQSTLGVNANLAWMIQESPSFIIPMYFLLFSNNVSWVGCVLLSYFTFHYGYRTLVYSYKIKGGKPTPILFLSLATLFVAANGYMQAVFLLRIADYPSSWMTSWNFILGTVIFFFGFYTHVRCDSIMRNLRKPGETGYKIPHGYMFDYVTGGNYFGEIMQWLGWALACWSAPALSFGLFTAAFVSSRSYVHHKWYIERFPAYPKNRKVVFPFIF